MNPTIVKIIDLMFRGIPETEETAAMREELLTNSQARYEDLIAAGESPDTALGQVLDNLRGMEDVLDEYRQNARSSGTQRSQSNNDTFPFAKFERMAEEIDDQFERLANKAEKTFEPFANRVENAFENFTDKTGNAARDMMDSAKSLFNNAVSTARSAMDTAMENLQTSMDSTGSSPSAPMSFSGEYNEGMVTLGFTADEARRINVQLIGEDVEIAPSPDGWVHLLIHKEDEPLYLVEATGGCLTLRHNPCANVSAAQQDTQPEELDGLSGILSGIGRALKGVFQFNRTSGDTVRLLLPDGLEQITLQTASGDIEVEALQQKAFAASTTSGDLDLSHCTFTGPVRLNTTSGDMDVTDTIFHDQVSLNTTSGDADFHACAPQVTANTVSGDLELEGDLRQIKANSVSGDLDFHPAGAFQNISANTTSGDISVTIPAGIAPNLRTNTTSGCVDVHCPTDMTSASLIHLNSVSGDLTVQNF